MNSSDEYLIPFSDKLCIPMSMFGENEIGILSSKGIKEISKSVSLLFIIDASSGVDIFNSGFASDSILTP